jgi:beta-galactosidase
MKEFMYAAGYYPLMQNRDDWVKDIESMKQCGIEYIRTAELFNAWDRIEPVEGKYDFGFLDDFFDLCDSYGMKIILGTGTASPPYWIHEKFPDVNILNNHGEQYPNHVSYSWACVDHPGFIKSVTEYVSKLVNRYKDHPALFCYQIHNEISLPFMPLQGGDIDLYCYCENSQEKFREWLKNKYKTIELVNFAYRWGATNTVYTDFSQITAPRTKCTSWASVTRWLDWRLFWMENLVEFVSFQNQLIKQFDTNHLTSTNIFFLKSQDPLGVITALDQFEMAKVVDVIGYDLYPGSGNKLENSHEFSSMFLSLAKSTAKTTWQRFLVNGNRKRPYWRLGIRTKPNCGW